MHRRLGRPDAAIADYEAAIRLSPPYPEPHYNLADLALERGDTATSRSPTSTGSSISNPTFVDAYVTRAGIHHELGDADGRRRRRRRPGPRPGPRRAALPGRCPRPRRAATWAPPAPAFDAAIEAEPDAAAAWANRAVLGLPVRRPARPRRRPPGRARPRGHAPTCASTGRSPTSRSIGSTDAIADYDTRCATTTSTSTPIEAGRQRCLAALAHWSPQAGAGYRPPVRQVSPAAHTFELRILTRARTPRPRSRRRRSRRAPRPAGARTPRRRRWRRRRVRTATHR